MQANGTIPLKAIRALLGLATALAALWLVTGSSRAGDETPGGPRGSSATRAEASAVKNLDETMYMRITKVKGKRVSAKGKAVGSVAGKGSFKLVLSNGSRATATFYGHNSYGTISGTGVAGYRVDGAISYYSGRITGLEGNRPLRTRELPWNRVLGHREPSDVRGQDAPARSVECLGSRARSSREPYRLYRWCSRLAGSPQRPRQPRRPACGQSSIR